MCAEENRDQSPERGRGTASERGAASRLKSPGGSTARPPDEARRKRPADRRYAGWGDGVERAYCVRDLRQVAPAFPVESHSGAATIPATVVARREGSLLLCTFTHAGPHEWPDGEETGQMPSD